MKKRETCKKFKYIKQVVKQETLDYTQNLLKLGDYVIHGDDWKHGIQKDTRKRVIKTLKKIKGKLIETKYVKIFLTVI